MTVEAPSPPLNGSLDYGHPLEFGYFLIPDAGDPHGVLETARLADDARLRPARRPGPSLPAAPPRHILAARDDPRPDGSGACLRGRRQPAAAAASSARQGGGDARSAERRPLRARHRRGRVPRGGAGDGRSSEDAGREPGGAGGGGRPHTGDLERRAPRDPLRRPLLPARRRPPRPRTRAPDPGLDRGEQAARAGPDRPRRRRLGQPTHVLQATARSRPGKPRDRSRRPRGGPRPARDPPHLQRPGRLHGHDARPRLRHRPGASSAHPSTGPRS